MIFIFAHDCQTSQSLLPCGMNRKLLWNVCCFPVNGRMLSPNTSRSRPGKLMWNAWSDCRSQSPCSSLSQIFMLNRRFREWISHHCAERKRKYHSTLFCCSSRWFSIKFKSHSPCSHSSGTISRFPIAMWFFQRSRFL